MNFGLKKEQRADCDYGQTQLAKVRTQKEILQDQLAKVRTQKEILQDQLVHLKDRQTKIEEALLILEKYPDLERLITLFNEL